MTLRNRFTLVGLGVVIFLLITPGLILFARGFQIDWKNRTFVKTGALVLKTEPAKAEFFLNDEKNHSTTPANVRFLLPGDYNIRIEKEGYQSWTKRLSVKSQLVTWGNLNRDFITLFMANPQLDEAHEIKNATVSRDADEIIFLKSDQIGLINVEDGDSKTVIKLSDFDTPLLSKDKIVRWQTSDQIFDLFSDKSLLATLESRMNQIQHLESDGRHILATIGPQLYSILGDQLILLEEDVSNFTLKNDGVWYIKQNSIWHYNIESKKTESIFSGLPDSEQSEIIRTNSQIYLILDKSLYLFNGGLEKIYGSVNYAHWNDDSGQMLYANNHEIFLYNLGRKESTLIVRSLTPVENPILNSETGYVFYQNEGKIKAIELDDRDHRNIFTIADSLDTFAISNDGKRLFTIGADRIREYIIR